ncbi:unnamed protein product [Closterium sp. NIES-53]
MLRPICRCSLGSVGPLAACHVDAHTAVLAWSLWERGKLGVAAGTRTGGGGRAAEGDAEEGAAAVTDAAVANDAVTDDAVTSGLLYDGMVEIDVPPFESEDDWDDGGVVVQPFLQTAQAPAAGYHMAGYHPAGYTPGSEWGSRGEAVWGHSAFGGQVCACDTQRVFPPSFTNLFHCSPAFLPSLPRRPPCQTSPPLPPSPPKPPQLFMIPYSHVPASHSHLTLSSHRTFSVPTVLNVLFHPCPCSCTHSTQTCNLAL